MSDESVQRFAEILTKALYESEPSETRRGARLTRQELANIVALARLRFAEESDDPNGCECEEET